MSTQPYVLPIPTQRTEVSTISSYGIQRLEVIPNTQANITVQLFNADQVFVCTLSMVMAGEEYQLWKSDDYLLAWIETQIYLAFPIPQ